MGAILSVPPSNAGSLARGRAWPSPFFDRVQMEFVLPAAMPVRMEVLDVRGRRVWESGTKPLKLETMCSHGTARRAMATWPRMGSISYASGAPASRCLGGWCG